MMRIASASVLLLVLSVSAAQAGTAALVRDLNTSRLLGNGSNPTDLTPLGDRVVFSAIRDGSGRELWSSDGTDAGSRMVADICPGPCSGMPEALGQTPGVTLWAASTEFPAEGRIWRSDGTVDGTYPLPSPEHPLEIVRPTNPSGQLLPFPHVEHEGSVYFNACAEGGQDCGLWKTDGTEEGTSRVTDTVQPSGNPEQLPAVSIDGALLFARGADLWKTNGTPGGTVLVAPFTSDAPHSFVSTGSRAFFFAGRERGRELWTSDGTAGGTRVLTNLAPAAPFWRDEIQLLGNRVYFAADDGTNGFELWRSDGTPAGTRRLTQLAVADPFHGVDITAVAAELGSRLVFQALDAQGRHKLWTMQREGGTAVPLEIAEGAEYMFPGRRLATVGGRALFLANDGVHGNEVWITDGTLEGTRMLRDFCPTSCGSSIVQFWPVAVPGFRGFAFVVAEGVNGPWQLWRSDATASGTVRLSGFSRAAGNFGPSLVSEVKQAGPKLFFTAQDGSHGMELWVAGIASGSARLATNVNPDDLGSFPRDLTPVGNQLFFGTEAWSNGEGGIWKTTGTPETTELVNPLRLASPDCAYAPCPSTLVAGAGGLFFVTDRSQLWWTAGSSGSAVQLLDTEGGSIINGHLIEHQGLVYFTVVQGAEHALWRSDGTVAGTIELASLDNLTTPSMQAFGVLPQNRLFFGFGQFDGPGEIWTTDGTPAGTLRVTMLPEAWKPESRPFVTVGNTLYFAAYMGENRSLWRTDGTSAGTRVVAGDFAVTEMAALGGRLILLAHSPDQGPDIQRVQGIWTSDGTPEGTVLLRELAFDSTRRLGPDAVPANLVPFAGRLYFAAGDSMLDLELWSTDGTTAGTRQVLDIHPEAGSRPAHLTAAGGRLFFTATDGDHGIELWESDGTAGGTRLVHDIAPGAASSTPEELTAAGDRLYFQANDGARGTELWTLPLAGAAACQPSARILCLRNGRFRVEAEWRDFRDNSGAGTAVPITSDTGTFWFFDPSNVELVVKVLDGRGTNDHHWVFYGALSSVEYKLIVTDTETGLTRIYFNPAGRLASVGDTNGFGPLGAHSPAPDALETPPSLPALASTRTVPAAATGTCAPGPRRLCLRDGRFAVEASWKDFFGNAGHGTAVALTADTGYFWFFDAANVEVVLKVLDGTAQNGNHWVFYGALSNVEYTLTVTDTLTGEVKEYKNPSGRFASVADTSAF